MKEILIKNMTVSQIRKVCNKYWPNKEKRFSARCDICPLMIKSPYIYDSECVWYRLGILNGRHLNKKYRGNV